MFRFLRKRYESQPMDVKAIRSKILQFVKEQLQRLEGGEAAGFRGLELFLGASPEERPFYEKAVYFNEGNRFREEIQRIADDYAISLPTSWTLQIEFAPPPDGIIMATHLPAGIIILNKSSRTTGKTTAYLHVLSGEANQKSYILHSTRSPIYIGREEKVQTSQGFFRINNVAFTSRSANDANKFISRQHAHIEWNEEEQHFFLFADEGGIPPRNKVKVQTSDGALVKLQTEHIGHPLKDGDQIMLGESAVLQFSFDPAPTVSAES